MLWIDLGEGRKAVLTFSIAECGQQSPRQVLKARGPLGFSPQPNNIHRAGSVWVFAVCAVATPLSLQKASSERCTHYHCNPLIWRSSGKFLQNSDTKTGNLLCLKCTIFNDKHMERTEAKVTPRLKANCSTAALQAGMHKERSHPLPTYLQRIFFCVNLPACE